MKRPFTLLILPLSLGIYFFYNTNISLNLSLIGVVILLMILLLTLYAGRGFKIVLVITIFCLGGLIVYRSVNDNELVKFKDQYVFIEGKVHEVLSLEEGYSRYIFTVLKVQKDKKTYLTEEKIILSVNGEQNWPTDERLEIEGTLEEPSRNSNPYLFNYKLYLQSKDIHMIMSANEYAINSLGWDKPSVLRTISNKFQNRVEKVFDFSLNKRNSNIMKSIILGDDSYIDEGTLQDFRDLGIAHILAVSGLHVGIIAYMLIFMLKQVSLNRKISTLIVIAILWSYGYLIGFPPSVLRALIMFTTLLMSNVTIRRYDPVNSLSFGAFILLVINPLWLFNPGFQLSFVATLSLLIFTRPINRIIFNENKKPTSKMSPLIAVQLGVIPVSLYHFNNLPLLSVVVNLVVIPLMSIGVILGFLIIVISILSARLYIYIGLALNLVLNVSIFITDLLGEFPLTNVLLGSPSLWSIVLYYMALFILLKLVRFNNINFSIKKTIFLYLIILNLVFSANGLIKEDVTIEFIDVGQGDASLLTIKGKNYLIDSGGSLLSNIDIGERIVGPYLLKRGIRRLDGVFISHFHEDHCKGLLYLLDNIRIDRLFIGYSNPQNQLYAMIIEKINTQKIPVSLLEAGDQIKITDSTKIEVLHPRDEDRNIYINENNLSLVLLLNSQGRKILFTGDIEKAVENHIINRLGKTSIDIIKVPHHGSKTSSSVSFIDLASPKAAVITVGKNNFGHPHDEVINRYKASSIDVYRTDNDGLINVIVSKGQINIQGYLKERPSMQNIIVDNWFPGLLLITYLGIGIFIIKIYNSTVQYNLKIYDNYSTKECHYEL